jgi:hypothetical protein
MNQKILIFKNKEILVLDGSSDQKKSIFKNYYLLEAQIQKYFIFKNEEFLERRTTKI